MTISLRLNNEDSILIKKFAEINNMSVSELVRQAVLERIEDEYDLKAYHTAMAAFREDPVPYSLDEAEKELGLIISWIRKNLEGCSDPRIHGKGLTANRSGEWRYRIGDYRLISHIQDDRVVILILEIGHRKDIYS